MKPAIFDTSVWIDFLNGKNTKTSRLLNECLERDENIFLTPLILQEILQGIRNDKEFLEFKELLSAVEMLTIDQVECAVQSAELYRRLRKKGVTVKRSIDC